LLNKPVERTATTESSSSLHSMNEMQWSDPLTADCAYECDDNNLEAINNLHEAMRHLNSTRGATD
jgi:hypothetical protein